MTTAVLSRVNYSPPLRQDSFGYSICITCELWFVKSFSLARGNTVVLTLCEHWVLLFLVSYLALGSVPLHMWWILMGHPLQVSCILCHFLLSGNLSCKLWSSSSPGLSALSPQLSSPGSSCLPHGLVTCSVCKLEQSKDSPCLLSISQVHCHSLPYVQCGKANNFSGNMQVISHRAMPDSVLPVSRAHSWNLYTIKPVRV